jgi:hypothetical protein
MKIYVLGWKTKTEEKIDHKRPWENIDVAYSSEPEWTMEFRELAEGELSTLSSFRPHVEQHYCDLAFEELPNGKFAIICRDHPERQAV